MFFKNLAVFKLPKNWPDNTGILEAQLSTKPLQPCGACDAQSIGWISPRANDQLVHSVHGQLLIALGAEQKLLPSSVVKQFASDKAKQIEENEGRRVGRKEMRDLCEAITLELLPRAFVRRRTTFGWIDSVNGWLVIDTPSSAKAEEFLALLRVSYDKFPATTLQVNTSPSSAMTGWVADSDAPTNFSIDQDLWLRSAENAEVRYVRHTLEGEDVREQIAHGKIATKLALTWNDRISFVLTESLQIKRLQFLDILKEQNEGQAENEEEQFDLDFTLMSGELAKMIADLVAALGSELVNEIAKVEEPKNDKMAELNTRLAELPPDVAYEEAKKIVIENQRASISLVQRHLRIGYNFAARLIEQMEKDGIVTPMNRMGIRDVLVRA